MPTRSPSNPSPSRAGSQPHADPRSPFVVDLRELGRRAGSLREYRRTATLPDDLGLDVLAVPAGSPFDLDLRLESVTEGVLVTGTVAATVRGQCGRCLDPLEDVVEVSLCELFAYAASATDETTGEDEVYRVDGDLLDTEPAVRDAVVLALPWTPLCEADCPGLCSTCGGRLADLPAGHGHDSIDPRWAALAAVTVAPSEVAPSDLATPDEGPLTVDTGPR